MGGRAKSVSFDSQERELIGSIYEAPLEPRRWCEVMARCADLVGAHQTIYTRFDISRQKIIFMEAHNVDPEPLLPKGYLIDNPLTRQGFIPPGQVATSDELVSLDELKRSRFYEEMMEPYDAAHGLLSVLLAEGETLTTFSLMGSQRRGVFDDEAKARLKRLVPHFARATQLSLRLAEVEGQRAQLAGVLDGLHAAVYLIDEDRRVCYCNRSGEAYARSGEVLTIRRRVLTLVDPLKRRELARLVTEAAQTGAGAGLDSGGGLTVAGPSGQPVDMLVSPLGRKTASATGWSRAVAAVIVGGLAPRRAATDAVLRRLYRLTGREARLTLALVEEDDLAAAAEVLGIRVSTARTHLKHIFEKVGCRRQSELIRRLLRGPLLLR